MGVLFTFPSRYWFAVGLSVVFSLAGWSPLIHAGFLVSRATQVPASSLRRGFAYGAVTLSGAPFQRLRLPLPKAFPGRPYNPGRRVATPPVWAPPRSLATTCGIIVIFFSSGY